VTAEVERIRTEYRRRAALDQERYAPTAPASILSAQELERAALRRLRADGLLPLGGRRVLDVGCGTGGWLSDFARWGAAAEDLAGIDLMDDRVREARGRLPGADLRAGDASSLPWDDASFDVVVTSMMFSSILDAPMRDRTAAEMRRVLRPGGVVLWYDFFVAHPGNRSTRGMRRREIARLFPGFEARLRRVTLAPPLARPLAARAWPAAAALTALRLLDTHHLGTLRAR
jgi:SAM-dependent methyltransferase